MPEPLLRAGFCAADAVLANSGHEPFGLVGLETMAAGGVAFTGATGEEYARHLENAIVVQTSDPLEIVHYVRWLQRRPDRAAALRAEAARTAERYAWPCIVGHLIAALECAFTNPAFPGDTEWHRAS